MKILKLVLQTVLILNLTLGVATSALGNDSTASWKLGGLVLKATHDLAMESEVLNISPNLIQVKYKFRNLTDHDIKTTVAFPLPQIVSEDEIGAYSSLNQSLKPLRFEVKVNGHIVKTQQERKASDCGSQGAVECLDYKIYWSQVFPAHSVITVEHKYRPFPAQGDLLESPKEIIRSKSRYCLSRGFLKHFKILRKKIGIKLSRQKPSQMPLGLYGLTQSQLNHSTRGYLANLYFHYSGVIGVDYILKTAKNWAGPIRDFTLTINKLSGDNLVSSCYPAMRKIAPTLEQFHAKNFVPQRDLSILFLFAHPQPAKHRASSEDVAHRRRKT